MADVSRVAPPSEVCSLETAPKYAHNEAATIYLHPSNHPSQPWSLHARVHLESTSSITSSSLLFGSALGLTGTPFSQHILQLVSKYKLNRLLIQIGDRSSSTGSVNGSKSSNHYRGAAGTSITASFLADNYSNDNIDKDKYKQRYATLLRHLLDRNLFPPCGAPLDSIRERKHGHLILVHSANDASHSHFVEVESNLAADASTFCFPEFILKNQIWGESTNGPCHSNDNWGLFDSLFAHPVDEDKSSSSLLSELLLGSALDSYHGDSGKDTRNSIWVELKASPDCFLSSTSICKVIVSRGISYGIDLPPPSFEDGTATRGKLPLTLGDLLLGRNTIEHSLENEGWKAWYPCPLSESSKINVLLPSGYTAMLSSGDEKRGQIEINLLTYKDEYLDLAEPWANVYPVDGHGVEFPRSTSTFGISRTVQRPLGITGPGTLVSVIRVGETTSSFLVDAFDVLPGYLIKPLMHSLRMVLYQGGGAGDPNFVPIGGYDYDACAGSNAFPQCTVTNRRALVLSELEDYNITHHTDGTVFVKRSLELNPDSSIWMMVDYTEAYLPFQKFPADANRGVNIFPSRATFTPVSTNSPQPLTTLYSPSLLILPPVPDMSMPFNVISLSCTLWAFVLGSMINILVRRGTESVKRELTGEKEKRPIDKLKEMLYDKGAKLKMLLKKLTGKSERKLSDESNGSQSH